MAIFMLIIPHKSKAVFKHYSYFVWNVDEKNDIQIYQSGFTKIYSRLQQTNSPYHASTFGNYTFPSPPTPATVVYLTGGAATRREPDCES